MSGGVPIVQTSLGFGSPTHGTVVETIRWTGALDLDVSASVEVERDAAGESAELTWSLAALAATADDDGDGTVNLLDQQPLDASVPQSVARPSRPRVLVIGLDGAGWDTLDPLMAGGYLPNLAALVDGGARAEIDETQANPAFCCFCPPQWASLVTGVRQSTHLMNKYESEPFERKAAAVWKALAADGGSYTTIDFRGTFPAEPGTTYSISEPTLTAAAHDLYGGWGAQVVYPEPANRLQGSWPPGLFESLGLTTAPVEPWLPAYVPMTADRLAYEALSRLNELDVSDLTMWLYHSPDKSMHLTWELVQATALDPVDGAALQLLGAAWTGPVVGPPDPLYWGDPASQLLEVDVYIGALVASPGYDYFVFLSDHSMARNAGFGLAGVHGPDEVDSHNGIFSITGPGVAAGADLGAISVLDVAPTLAYVLGVPIADDLPGSPLVDAFTADHLAAVPVLSIPHWR